MIHRDLKPDNIFVSLDEEGSESVKVLDFGLAKLREEANEPAITQVGLVLGTPLYMSPEQCCGETLDARSDVYSLAAVTYEMISGFPPFQGNNFASISAKHQYEPPPPFVTELGVSEKLQTALLRGLAKQRDQRQADANELSKELEAALREHHSTEHE